MDPKRAILPSFFFGKRELYFSIIFCQMLYGATCSQNIALDGRVSIANSLTETGKTLYVEGALVSALDHRDSTDSQGRFQLRLVQQDPTSRLTIEVYKEGLEVTNPDALESVHIGSGQLLQVYMAPAGTLAKREAMLLEVSQRKLLAEKDSLHSLLRLGEEQSAQVTQMLSKRLGRSFENRFEAMDALMERFQEMERRLPDFARELAGKNLDVASELYREAYELFGKGEIAEAIAVLDSTLLESSLREGRKSLLVGQRIEDIGKELQGKGRLMVQQAIDSYALKGDAYLLRFQYREAAQQYERIVAIYTEDGLDSLELAKWHDKAGEAHQNNGSYKEAMEHYMQALVIREETLDSKHLDLATSYGNVASAYRSLGEYPKALEYQKKTILIQEEILGPKHPELAISYNNMGLINKYMGNYMQALEYHQRAIKIQKEVLSSKHPDLATSYSSISKAYNSLGEYQEALRYQQKAITVREEVLDPKHPDLSSSYSNMASIYHSLGTYEKALAYQEKATAIMEEVLGPQHPYMAISHSNMGGYYMKLGRYNKAIEFNKKAIAIEEEVLDTNHPGLTTSYNNIAATYHSLGEYHKALEYFQKAIAIKEEVLDSKHPSLATYYNNIASTYRSLGEYEEALKYQQKAIAILEIVLDSKHPKLAASYGNVGTIYKYLERYNQALEQYQRAMAIMEEVLDPRHPHLVTTYVNVASIYHRMGQYQKALGFYESSIAIFEETLDPKHPDLATSYHGVGNTYRAIGDPTKAMEYLQKALAIRKEALPPKHPDLARTYYDLGLCYHGMARYKDAIVYYQQAATVDLKIEEKEYYNDLGLAYAKNGQLEEARTAFKEYEHLFPEKGESYRNWALYYALMGNQGESLAHLKKAVALGYKDLEWLEQEEALNSIRESGQYRTLAKKIENAQTMIPE